MNHQLRRKNPTTKMFSANVFIRQAKTRKRYWIALTWKIKKIVVHDGDFQYLARCSNVNWTTIPTRYGTRARGTRGKAHCQAKTIVAIGIVILSSRVATEETWCPNSGVRVTLPFAEWTGCLRLIKESSRRTKTATPQ